MRRGPAAVEGERYGLSGAWPGEAAGLAQMASNAARHRAAPLEAPLMNHWLVIEAPHGREVACSAPGSLRRRLTSNTRSYYRTRVSHYAGVFEQWKLRWEHGGRRVRHHQAGHPLGYRSVTSVDGTRLRSWSNEGRGVPC